MQTGIVRQGKAMKNWEEELTNLGRDGWELVAIIPMHVQMGLQASTPQIRCFLKREYREENKKTKNERKVVKGNITWTCENCGEIYDDIDEFQAHIKECA